MAGLDMKIEWETRLCEVDGELGYFHTWEQYAKVIDPSIRIGGHPGGQISWVFGIVEFKDGVRCVDPYRIKFCDEKNAMLNEMAKHMKEESQGLIILSEDEKAILRNLDKRYKWIARSFGTLQIFEDKPYKHDCGEAWNARKGYKDVLRFFNHLFTFIKATDEEPYSIEYLLTRGNEND